MATWYATGSYVMSSYFTVGFEARHGGRINTLAHGNAERTRRAQPNDLLRTRVPFPFGMMYVSFYQESYWHSELTLLPWNLAAATASGTVQVDLVGNCPSWPGIGATKRFRIGEDPWIDWEVGLDGEAAPGSPFQTPIFVIGAVMNGRGQVFAPGNAGPVVLPRWPQELSLVHGLSAGWIAWVGDTGGVAWTLPSERVRDVRVLHGDNDRIEWVLRRVPGSATLAGRMIPFRGLGRVDAVGAVGVASLTQSPTGVTLSVYSLLTGSADILVQWLPDGGPAAPLLSTRMPLWAGNVATASFPSTASGAGVWRVTLERGPSSMTFEVRGGLPTAGALVSRTAAALPLTEVAREPSNSRPAWPKNLRFEALPVPFRTPWLTRAPGERIRVLALVPSSQSAPVLAMAAAFDFDLTLPFIPGTMAIPQGPNGPVGVVLSDILGDRSEGATRLTGNELIRTWEACLAPTRVYDVILIQVYAPVVDGWSALPLALQTAILQRVQAGTGLVVIRRGASASPAGGALESALAFAAPLSGEVTGTWQVPVVDPTTSGLPWACMPGVFRHAFIPAMRPDVVPAPTLLLEVPRPANQTPAPVLARRTYGQGRVLDLAWGRFVVPANTNRPRPAGTEGAGTYTYDLAFLARLVLDASRRVPPITVREVTVSPPGANTRATVQLLGTAPKWELSWTTRNRRGDLLAQGSIRGTGTPGTVAIPGAPGAWFVEVVVIPNPGEPAWGAGARVLNIPLTATPPGPVLGRRDRTSVRPNLPAATTFIARLHDGRGRVVEEDHLAPGESFVLDAARVETPRAELHVLALDGAQNVIGEGIAVFQIRREGPHLPWVTHFWSGTIATPEADLLRRIDAHRAFGVTCWGSFNDLFFDGLVPTSSFDMVTASDHLGLPYVVAARGSLVLHMTMQGSTAAEAAGNTGGASRLSDREADAQSEAADALFARQLEPHNVHYYRVCDDEADPPVTDTSFHPRDLADFARWLDGRYQGRQSAFTASWGSGQLTSPVPLPLTDAISSFATTDTYAPWVDHRLYAMDRFSRWPAISKRALRSGDPRARIGTSGESVGALRSGIDVWARSETLDLAGRYGESSASAYQASGAVTIRWTGYDDPAPILRYRLGAALGSGESGVAIYHERTHLNPDLTLPAVGRDLQAALLPANRGLGALFAASKPYPHGVFVLLSPESSPVLAIHGFEGHGRLRVGDPPFQPNLGCEAREHVIGALQTVGISDRTISPADVELGELERAGARVLILPMAAALSDRCCAAIRRWVEAGGTVIADLLPGVFNEHGRLRGTSIGPSGALVGSSNPLDAVFGLTAGARPVAAPAANPPVEPAVAELTVGGGSPFRVRLVDRGATVTTAVSQATAAGVGPLWFRNNCGRGVAWYLGCSFFSDFLPGGHSGMPYPLTFTRAVRLAAENAFVALLAGAGVTGAAAVEVAGARVGLVNVFARRHGDLDLIVVARNYGANFRHPDAEPAVRATIRFPGVLHTWDTVEGSPLGRGDRLDIVLDNHTVRIFARAAYDVRAIELAAPTSLTAGHDLPVTATLVTTAPPGPHRLRFDVLDAAGHAIVALTREAVTQDGRCSFTVRTALNDPAGPWKILVTDIATGVTASSALTLVQQPAPVPMGVPFQIHRIDD